MDWTYTQTMNMQIDNIYDSIKSEAQYNILSKLGVWPAHLRG